MGDKNNLILHSQKSNVPFFEMEYGAWLIAFIKGEVRRGLITGV